MRLLLATVVASAVLCGNASAQTRDFKPLVVGALDAPTGELAKTFAANTPWVQVMRQKLGTEGPITVTTKVVKRFKEEGCGRVEATFLVHDAKIVKTSARGVEDTRFAFQLNVCRDGMPPVEGMDLRDLQRAVSGTAGSLPGSNQVTPATPYEGSTKVPPR